ncbi:hypothetical protein D8S78_02250 [Natrialba swarupiae]|nr:hypothetical protein [Natrialba swarupiae]
MAFPTVDDFADEEIGRARQKPTRSCGRIEDRPLEESVDERVRTRRIVPLESLANVLDERTEVDSTTYSTTRSGV